MLELLTKPFKKFKTLPSEAVILKSNLDPDDDDDEDKEDDDEDKEDDEDEDEAPGIGDS